MIIGILSMVAYNLADTYFVGQLGKNQLAALSFTFPVVLIIGSIALGIGMGASVLIARAIGKGNISEVRRFATDSLILAVIIVAFFVVTGLLTIKPLFTLLGADPQVLPYIQEYMGIWYYGVMFVVFPMVGNNIIRATGDSRIPGLVMLIGATANTIMDPILIFGWGPIPALGISGAAISTVISRGVTFFVALYVLLVREKILTFRKAVFQDIWNSWKQILFIGIPNAGSKMIFPLGVGIITAIIAPFGSSAVAGYGVASRVEFFSLTLVNALASVLGPFIGQNFGAGKIGRVNDGFRTSEEFSIFNGLFFGVLLFIFAEPIARLFNDHTDVIQTTVLYLRIVPFVYALQGIYLISIPVLNVFKKPLHASGLGMVEMFALNIPLAYLGSLLLGPQGIFIALAISYCLTGILSHFTVKREIVRECTEAQQIDNGLLTETETLVP
jgi:putative MATE family efflux protein